MTSNTVKAVFFDAGNTLLRVHPSIGEIYSDAARRFGVDIAAETIEASFKAHWIKTGPLVTNEGHRLSYERERDWWRHIVGQVFSSLIQFKDFDAFFDYLYARFAESDSWRLYEDSLTALDQLQSRGFRMAIVSNWDSRLPALCDALGITPYFEAVIVSALVGFEKPHPAIFEIALRQTGLQPEEVLYIGDDPFLDYQAARKAGLHALHLDRNQRFEPHEHRIASLNQLPERVQL